MAQRIISKAVGDSDDNEPEFHEEDLETLPPSTSAAEINQSPHTDEPSDC